MPRGIVKGHRAAVTFLLTNKSRSFERQSFRLVKRMKTDERSLSIHLLRELAFLEALDSMTMSVLCIIIKKEINVGRLMQLLDRVLLFDECFPFLSIVSYPATTTKSFGTTVGDLLLPITDTATVMLSKGHPTCASLPEGRARYGKVRKNWASS